MRHSFMTLRGFDGLRRGAAFCATAALTAVVLFVQPTLADVGRGRLFVQPEASATELPIVHVTGAISTDTTWTADALYVVDTSLTINAGVTLSINPGVIVKMAYYAGTITVNGTLQSNGTEAAPVVWTSIKDDAHGGDTNNDGSATSPAPGDWYRILFNSAAGASSLTNSHMLYAGYTGGALYVAGSSPTLDSLLISDSKSAAVYVSSGAPTITNNEISDCPTGVHVVAGSPIITGNQFAGPCTNAAIYVELMATPQISGNTGTGYNHRILLKGGQRSASWTLTNGSFPYVLENGTLTVNSNTTLTIDPGVVLKMPGVGSIAVNGTLISNGTADQPVVITSLKDDAHGGDTNNDGSATSPAPGNWSAIAFNASAVASGLSHTQILYGGAPAYSTVGAVYITGSSPVLDSVVISQCANYGVRAPSGAPVITNSVVSECPVGVLLENPAAGARVEGCEFSSIANTGVQVVAGSPVLRNNLFSGPCAKAAIYVEVMASPVLDGNTGSGYNHRILLRGVTRSVSWRLTKESFPYVLESNLTIGSGATLTIDPGVVIKTGYPTYSITANGTLLSNGTESQPVVFTSLKDDAHGGDTNNDGSATSPAPGDWYKIYLTSTSGASRLSNTDVMYAGYAAGTVWVEGSSPALDSVRVSKSKTAGVYVFSGAPTITHSTITNNTGAGVYVSSVSAPWPAINWNDIYNNGTGGTVNLTAPVGSGTDARYNYWGRTSGPRDIEKTYAACEPWLWYSFKTPKSAQVLGGDTPCGIWGEPVNTATGNFYYQAVDLTLAGVGPAISVGRTYNHQDASSRGVLGYGWTLDADSFVQPQSDGSGCVVYPGGSRKTFAPDGNGGYVSPAGTLEALSTPAGGGYTLTFIDRTVNTYTASGTLSSVTDRYGNTVTYTRNALGAITRIEGAGGRFVTFTYTSDLLTKVADNAGRQVTYAYTASGDLRTVTDVAGAVTTYTSDAQHRVTQVASAEHPTEPFVSHGYDAENRVAVQYDGYGNVGTLSYAEGATTITNNRGFTQLHQFDDEFRLTGDTDGAGNTTHRTYNAAGLVETLTDGNSHATSFTYDANGNRTSATDAANHTTRAAYDLANNNISWSEDAEGVRTTYAYDATGAYLERVTNPVFEVVYGHYANGLVESVTLAGATTHYAYDAAGRLTSVTDSLGATSTLTYDTAGNLTSTTDAMGRAASFTYDAAGRVLTASDSLCATATSSYDGNGNRTTATDQLGKTTHFSYDVLDKLSGVTDPLSNDWAYTYDENYNLATVTNPNGATTSYTYSADDLLTETQDALGHTWAFTHDAVGNTLESEYPTGETVTRTYTADDLLATSTYSTGESYAFAYTPAHRLEGVSGTGGTFAFDYNPVGWLLAASDTVGTPGQFVTTYTYDDAGRVTALDSAAAPAVIYAYDLAGRLASLEASGAVASFTHDASGARTGMSLPNGASTSYGYDVAGRIESIVTTAASGVIAESYSRDGAGRVTADSQGAYAYDDAGRLTSWTAPGGEITTYTYDAAGNLTGASVDGSATAGFAVDAADRITSPGFSYDDAGNLTSDGERTFTYDAAGRLTAVADASAETTIAAYAYDAFNRRVSATEGGATVFFHYDGASARVIAETDGSGATIASYTYDDAGQLFSMTRGSETYSYHLNARGDVVALTDSTGALVNTYAYDPWGAPLSASESVANPYRYASYRYDTSTGLYHCWNRYYAPELARFLTRDIYPGELSDPVTMNPYLYCGGDPVNRVDWEGRAAVAAVLVPVGIVVALAAALWMITPQGNAAVTGALSEGYDAMRDALRSLATVTPWTGGALGWDPTVPPGAEWEWHGKGEPGCGEGSWYNPETGWSAHPDLTNEVEGPHWDVKKRGDSRKTRVDPDTGKPIDAPKE